MKGTPKMLSKFITEGMRLELQAASKTKDDPADFGEKIFMSKVYDVMSEDTIEILMPMEKQKLVMLGLNREYTMRFYGETGLYQCTATVADRYKSGNVYILLMELTSNLQKYQRREYYRFSCVLEMNVRNLTEEEREELEEKQTARFHPEVLTYNGVIVDISGGGIRFVSRQRFQPGSFIFSSFGLKVGGIHKTYVMVSRVLASRLLENRNATYEHRAQFYNLEESIREDIIKYVFEEERKSRRK